MCKTYKYYNKNKGDKIEITVVYLGYMWIHTPLGLKCIHKFKDSYEYLFSTESTKLLNIKCGDVVKIRGIIKTFYKTKDEKKVY